MKQVKAEIIDIEYDEQQKWRKREENDDDALMVARRIKQEFEDAQNSPTPPPPPRVMHVIHENHRPEIERPAAPLVFDHFICMRIGLNSRNNVQRLMALLTAHEFVDLTVLPGPSMMPPPMQTMIQMGVPHHPTTRQPRMMMPCAQEPSTSCSAEIMEVEPRMRLQPQHVKLKKNFVKKLAPKPSFIRSAFQPSADCGIIPINMNCKKCDEIIPKGSHGSSALNHVQKNHLKMAAFQCRICKHYRTTQERIQSHVTTVHKAKSTKFDSSLAGPLSADDMKKMEEMITHCFPKLKMELQVTDRLIAKTMEVDLK
ncbi:unnamed protein product [Caenorhabditis sp. 36 PRJEB53466]|nr:unnamed protein product [Caenorhabditis sp. 36 PRJEB53466]